MTEDSGKRPLGTRWCKTGIFLAIIATVLTVVGIGGGVTRLLSGVPAMMAFGLGVLVFGISALVLVVGLALSKATAGAASTRNTVIALVTSIVVVGAGLSQWPTDPGPGIHDLTTDTDNPPEFVAVVPLRADAPNPPDYAGGDTADKQKAAYPELATLTLDMPTPAVFAAAEQVVVELGWDLVEADLMDGRVEATDTTAWFGFKDDVVIRIVGDGETTWVDVRSKSRVGMGDMGTNARRIHTFLDALIAKTGG